MQWLLLAFALEFVPVLALLDAWNRPEEHFEGGAPDRSAWVKWLWIGVATAWFLVGNAVVLGYYYSVVRRNSGSRF